MLKDRNITLELLETVKINNELDDKGKPKYSNETQRKAELSRRLSLDKIYTETKTRIIDEESDMSNIINEVEHSRRLFSIKKCAWDEHIAMIRT